MKVFFQKKHKVYYILNIINHTSWFSMTNISINLHIIYSHIAATFEKFDTAEIMVQTLKLFTICPSSGKT